MKSDMISTTTCAELKYKLDGNKYNLPKEMFRSELFFKVTSKVILGTLQEVILLDGDAANIFSNSMVST